MGKLEPMTRLTDPKRVVVVFPLLGGIFSSFFWHLIAVKPRFVIDIGIIRYSLFLLVRCPGVTAIVTSLAFQKNVPGCGFRIGELRWWLVAMIIPIITGGIMYGTAWISGIAPFIPDKAWAVLTVPMIPVILTAICMNIISATGEEIGWRGLLVPELGRYTTFTWVAHISAFIWFCWHVPVMLA